MKRSKRKNSRLGFAEKALLLLTFGCGVAFAGTKIPRIVADTYRRHEENVLEKIEAAKAQLFLSKPAAYTLAFGLMSETDRFTAISGYLGSTADSKPRDLSSFLQQNFVFGADQADIGTAKIEAHLRPGMLSE